MADELTSLVRAASNRNATRPRDYNWAPIRRHDPDADAYMGCESDDDDDTESKLLRNNMTHAARHYAGPLSHGNAHNPFAAAVPPPPRARPSTANPSPRLAAPVQRRTPLPSAVSPLLSVPKKRSSTAAGLPADLMNRATRILERDRHILPPKRPHLFAMFQAAEEFEADNPRDEEDEQDQYRHYRDDQAEEGDDDDDDDDDEDQEEPEYYEEIDESSSRAAHERRAPAADGESENGSDGSAAGPRGPIIGGAAAAAAAAAVPAPGAVAAASVFVPIDELRLLEDRYPNAQRIGPEHCFFCRFTTGGRSGDISRGALATIMDMIAMADSGACRVSLAEQIQAYYDEFVRDEGNLYLAPGTTPFPEVTVPQVYYHFFSTSHNLLDANECRSFNIRVVQDVIRTIAKYEIKKEGVDASGRIVQEIPMAAFLKMERAMKLSILLYNPAVGKKIGIGGATAGIPSERASGPLRGNHRLYGNMPGGFL